MNSIEWFVNQVEKISNNKTLSKQKSIDLYNKAIEEAKEMHKQEIIDFARHCLNKAKDTDILTAFINTQQYYQETFGSKGSDTLKDYHIVDTNEMVEISDEEIEKESWGYREVTKDMEIPPNEDWSNGAKWYREQLKQKQ